MKKIYTAFVFVFLSVQVFSQTASAVVFSENGEKFTITLNGEKQNTVAQSNVKISNLTNDYYQARIDFEDATLADFSHGNFAVLKGAETTYVIKKNKKGEYVLRWMSQTEPGTTAATPAPASTPSSEVKQIAAVDDDGGDDVVIEHAVDVAPVDDEVETTVVKTTTTTSKPATTTKTAGKGENVNMNVNIGGVNMGMNVSVQDDGMDMDTEVEEESATTVTTTTTKTTTTAKPAVKPAPKPATPAPAPKPEVVVVESKGGCVSSMSGSSFNSAKSSIQSKSFEDSKMTVAKQVTKANCLTVDQIKEVMALFSFEESKLDYAKYAYDFCYNPGDYFLVNDAFTFESSIDELNQFLESK
ncbi:MAG: DUF4476 domain-containing protein [Flavobacteriales bacterium]|nr:DUF4476 domain-containing protein [Flavobacteriales bacterium]